MKKEEIVRQFYESGVVKDIAPYGEGHINDTYRVVIEENGREKLFILQRMNTNVFPDVSVLMRNGTKVTE